MAQQIKTIKPKGLPVGWYWDFIPVMIVKVIVPSCCEGLVSVDPPQAQNGLEDLYIGVFVVQSCHHFYLEYNLTETKEFFFHGLYFFPL